MRSSSSGEPHQHAALLSQGIPRIERRAGDRAANELSALTWAHSPSIGGSAAGTTVFSDNLDCFDLTATAPERPCYRNRSGRHCRLRRRRQQHPLEISCRTNSGADTEKILGVSHVPVARTWTYSYVQITKSPTQSHPRIPNPPFTRPRLLLCNIYNPISWRWRTSHPLRRLTPP